MSSNPKLDRILARVDPGRRDAMRRILVTAAYAAPVVATFSLDAMAQQVAPFCANQGPGGSACAVPTTSQWTLVTMAGELGAAGVFMMRRRRQG